MPGLILRGEEELEQVLVHAAREPRTTAVFCDIDGTISPIAPTPAEAKVPDHVRAALATLAPRLGLLAFVTGRAVRDGARMVGLKRAVYIGTHGLELMDGAGLVSTTKEAERYVADVQAVAEKAARASLDRFGIVLENKHVVLAVHYRLAQDLEAAQKAIFAAVIRPARELGLLLTTGKYVVEVRPPLEVSKGSATLELLQVTDAPATPSGPPVEPVYRTALFLGDDVTDVTGFAAVHAWLQARPRSRSGCAVAAVSEETRDQVKEASDVWVAGVEGVYETLRRLLAATSPTGAPRRRGLS